MILIDLLAGDVNNWRTVTFKYRYNAMSIEMDDDGMEALRDWLVKHYPVTT